MLDIYLSDQGFKSILNKSHIYHPHIVKLAHTIDSIEGLYLHNYPNIKRLKGRKPTVWRYRVGDDRIIFTVGSIQHPYLIIHRIASRDNVYKQLPSYFSPELKTDLEELIIDDKNDDNIEIDTYFHNVDRYYKLSSSFIKNDLQSTEIIDFILHGNYRLNPCLNSEQQTYLHNINPNNSFVYQIQGTAGTGKTTLAFFLADKVIKENIFPIIITPNKHLKKFGNSSLTSLNQSLNIFDNEFEKNLYDQSYDLALFSRYEFIQKLANETLPCLTVAQGCKIMNDYFKKRKENHQISKYSHLNIYEILLSFVLTDSINCSRDNLTPAYQDVIDYLKEIWKPEHIKMFQEKDAFSQAQKALNNLSNHQHWLEKLSNKKPILFIIDEVQDFYWFQLKVLFDLSQYLPITFVLLGDENQRVNISGFSKDNFRTIFAKNYNYRNLVNEIVLSQNFRNTKQIAHLAKYLLEGAFTNKIQNRGRKLPPVGDPNQCYDQGLKPRLIKINDQWFNDLLTALASTLKNPNQEHYYTNQIVFLYRDLIDLSDSTIEKLSDLEDKDKIIFYNISEAKGQEFEATVILFPFLISKKSFGYDDLFQLYTAITRARHYQCFLVREEELNWLKNTANNFEELSTFLDIYENFTVEEFIEELNNHGQSLITLQQRQQKFINHILNHDLYRWLKTGILPSNLSKKWQNLHWNWWQFLEQLIDKIDDSLIKANLLNQSLNVTSILDSFKSSNLLEIIIFYWSVKYLYIQGGLDIHKLLPIQRQILKSLQENSNEIVFKELINDLDKINFLDLKALIFTANNLSWKAVSLFKNSQYDRLYNRELEIKEIILTLEDKGLQYEAMRIKVQYLEDSFSKKLPFNEVLNQEGKLVNLLCNSFLNYSFDV